MDFNFARRNSLFNPVTQPGINPSALQITPDMIAQSGQPVGQQDQQDQLAPPVRPQQNLTDVYSGMMNAPSGPANQRYKDFLGTPAPKRDDYQPGKMNRLAAVLSGISAGAQGGNGFKAANDVLDDPFNEATADYKNQASRLSEGAGQEDKETNNKVKTYRDFVTDQHNRGLLDIASQREGREAKATDADIKYKQARVLGIETPEQKKQRELDVAKGRADATFNNNKNLFDYEAPKKQANEMSLVHARGAESRTTLDQKFENIKDLKQYVHDNIAPDKYDYRVGKDGFLYGINKEDPTDTVKTAIDTGKLNDQQKIDLGTAAKIKLKQTAAPDKTTKTTTKVSGNTRTTETDTKFVPSGKKVSVISPAGVEGTIDEAELEQAKKAGYKVK